MQSFRTGEFGHVHRGHKCYNGLTCKAAWNVNRCHWVSPYNTQVDTVGIEVRARSEIFSPCPDLRAAHRTTALPPQHVFFSIPLGHDYFIVLQISFHDVQQVRQQDFQAKSNNTEKQSHPRRSFLHLSCAFLKIKQWICKGLLKYRK